MKVNTHWAMKRLTFFVAEGAICTDWHPDHVESGQSKWYFADSDGTSEHGRNLKTLVKVWWEANSKTGAFLKVNAYLAAVARVLFWKVLKNEVRPEQW